MGIWNLKARAFAPIYVFRRGGGGVGVLAFGPSPSVLRPRSVVPGLGGWPGWLVALRPRGWRWRSEAWLVALAFRSVARGARSGCGGVGCVVLVGVPLRLVARSLRGAGWGVGTGPCVRAQPWGRERLSWACVGACVGACSCVRFLFWGFGLCCVSTTPPDLGGWGACATGRGVFH